MAENSNVKKGIRFYITESCNAKCPNCFNRDMRKDVSMDYSKFTQLCDYFSLNGYEHLKIMGGEPTTLTNLKMYVTYAQSKFNYISIFTNAINDNIENLPLRELDRIVYNFRFYKILSKSKLLLNKPGQRALEIQVTTKTDEVQLFTEIKRIVDYCPSRIGVYLTLDCTSDIFKEKEIVLSKHRFLWEKCIESNIKIGQDHIIPLCYTKGSHIPIPKKGAFCSIDCAGLIDANYNLKFCNQHSKILTNMFDNDTLKPFSTIKKHLQEEFVLLQKLNTNKGCNSCVFYNVLCNGGCFIPKDINTPLPI